MWEHSPWEGHRLAHLRKNWLSGPVACRLTLVQLAFRLVCSMSSDIRLTIGLLSAVSRIHEPG